MDDSNPTTEIDSKCPICGNTANKTNLHLIPWFIIKHYITQQGTGIRDKELSFTISSDHLTKLFAGRSVLPEKLEEFGGLHDSEKEEENPYSRDHLWCDKCEKKFSRLEAIFSTRFSETKMRKSLTNHPIYKDHRIVIDNGMDNSIFQLFIQSIFWRCSIGKFDGFTLQPDIENKIKENLQEAFKTENFLELKAADQLPLKYSFPVFVSLLHVEPEDDSTKEFIMLNKSKAPYFIMGGKWLFQLFTKEGHIRGTQEWLYGLRHGLDTVAFFPKITGKPHVLLHNQALSQSFTQNRLDSFIEKKTLGLRRIIREAHVKFFRTKPTPFIENYILQQYFSHSDSGKTEFESFVHAFYDLKNL